ncbi:response regulator [Pedobacter chinensis]|uniref:histidine kinase n=1 Tax=Pedobacter chinensis TaxID=2282421 RepID=A0A369PZK1_9SPHI|nr:ATP-binding protein [Pedobacter chinensis]RDC56186.1 response regulator [Pedobacter chinensis]
MGTNFLSFEVIQLNRLFPYFILLDTDMCIRQMSDLLKNICGDCTGNKFFDHFESLDLRNDIDQHTFGKTINISLKTLNGSVTGKLESMGSHELYFFAGEKYREKDSQWIMTANTDAGLDAIDHKPDAPSLSERHDFDNIIKKMGFGLLEMDINGEIIYANDIFCTMSGYDLTYIKGKIPGQLFANEFFSTQHLPVSTNDLVSELNEIEFLDANGDQKLWLASRSINYNNRNENHGWVIICLDISQYRSVEQKLIMAKMDAERMANVKEMFLANMSHEIRTPMNAIMSMSNQLSKTTLNTEQDYYVQTIQTASKNLLVIINDILDLSKIDAGMLKLEYIGFNLSMVLTDVMQVIMHKAQKKGLEIGYIPPMDINISNVLMGDPYRINQVVLNLMSNAIKFTEKGSVFLTATVLQDHEDSQEIEILVKDTGIGMDPEFVDRLFDNFSQEYESVSRKYGGTGLGMSISQKLVSQMGGHFKVKSKKGEGSEISFVVDFKKGLSTDLPNETKTIHNEDLFLGRKILIVDDNEMNRLVASTILLSYGAQVIIAENGEIALQMVSEEGYDIILMDIQMPVLNGYDTTRMLRERGYEGIIIALTASAILGEREKCIGAGMDDYITKPINEELLVSVLDSWMKRKADPIKVPELNLPLYNLDGLRLISKGREDFVTKMIELFCEQMPVALTDLNSSIQQNDLPQVSKIAHKLKSTIDHLGIMSIQRTIRSIETLSDENGSNEELLLMIAEVDSTLNQVIKELKLEIMERNKV